jgi:hypothetical protein
MIRVFFYCALDLQMQGIREIIALKPSSCKSSFCESLILYACLLWKPPLQSWVDLITLQVYGGKSICIGERGGSVSAHIALALDLVKR